MPINVTSANVNRLRNGARVLIRNSSGTPYVVVQDTTQGGIEVWKGNSTTPTSFSEMDSTNNPQTSGYCSPSAAIDSNDIIHIAYMYFNGKSSQLRYVTFNANGTTDAFSGDVAVIADIGEDPTSILLLFTAIAIDSNNIPHIAYTEYISNMGSPYYTVKYNNKIGGTWNSSSIEVEGQENEVTCLRVDITIDLDNKPCIGYNNSTFFIFSAAIGDANDPTGFTLFDIHDTSSTILEALFCGIAVDSNGNHHFAFSLANNSNDIDVAIRKHIKTNAWTSWETIEIVDNTSVTGHGRPTYVTLAIDGTNRYIFCVDHTSKDIVYYTDSSGSWSDQNTLETGTFEDVKVKWAYKVNRGSNGTNYGGISGIPEIDYAFVDPAGDDSVKWNTLSLGGAPPGRTTKNTDVYPLGVNVGVSWRTPKSSYGR